MIRQINSARSARRNQRNFRREPVKNSFSRAESVCAQNFIAVTKKFSYVDVIKDFYVRKAFHSVGKDNFNIFAVDFDVSPAALNIIALRILFNHQSEPLNLFCNVIQTFRNRLEQFSACNSVRVGYRVVHIVFRRVIFADVSVQRINSRRKATATSNIRLFHDTNFYFRI